MDIGVLTLLFIKGKELRWMGDRFVMGGYDSVAFSRFMLSS
jgi:hypothetical protein